MPRVFRHVGFFLAICEVRKCPGSSLMKKLHPTMAQQVARAISVFQEQRTGYLPKAVTVVLSDDTLVVTLHEALLPPRRPWPAPPRAPFRCRSFTDSSSRAPSTCCARRSSDYRGRGGRSRRGSGDDDRRRRACLHDRHDGAGVPARRQNPRRRLERQWTQCLVTNNTGLTN